MMHVLQRCLDALVAWLQRIMVDMREEPTRITLPHKLLLLLHLSLSISHIDHNHPRYLLRSGPQFDNLDDPSSCSLPWTSQPRSLPSVTRTVRGFPLPNQKPFVSREPVTSQTLILMASRTTTSYASSGAFWATKIWADFARTTSPATSFSPMPPLNS